MKISYLLPSLAVFILGVQLLHITFAKTYVGFSVPGQTLVASSPDSLLKPLYSNQFSPVFNPPDNGEPNYTRGSGTR
jgi:hypothetical protein